MKQFFTLLGWLFLLQCPLFLLGQQHGNSGVSALSTGTPPSLSFITSNVCGNTDGCATVVVAGSSSGQLGYLWSNGATTATVCNLTAGQYSVTVTDTVSGGTPPICTAVADTTIFSAQFVVAGSIDSIAGATCEDDMDGSVDLAVSGGSMPYSFLWSNGTTTQNISNLTAGAYFVTITDDLGCTFVDTAVVPVLGAIDLVLDSLVNPFCNDSTGAIFARASGDTVSPCNSPVVRINEFMYRPTAALNNGRDPYAGEYIELIGPAGADISCYVLADGDWTITMPQGTIIPSDGIFTIGNDSIWGVGTFDLDAENCNCFTDGTNAGLLILTDGGETISLFDASGTFIDGVIYSSPTPANQPFGNTYNTIGLAGCVTSVTIPAASAFSTAPGGLQPNTSLARDPDGSGAWVPQVGGSLNDCNVNGFANGNRNFTYLWSTGDTTSSLTGVPAGTYTVTTTNSFGCTDTASYTLIDSNSIMIMDSVTNIDCAATVVGGVSLTVTGGTAPYMFNWTTGDTTSSITNLLAGTYCATVTDNNGCMADICATVVEDSLDIPMDTLYICPGDSILLPLNTTLTSVVWTPSSSLNNDTLLNPIASPTTTTTYVVEGVGSASFCDISDSVVVVVTPVVLTPTTIGSLACFGDSTVSIVVTSNLGGLSYLWNTGDTTADLTNVAAGMYTLIANDSTSSCTDTVMVTITQPDSLQLSISGIMDVTCRSGNDGAIDSVVVTGGTAAYSYLWSTSATTDSLDNLTSGNYFLTVTDANGCTVTGFATVDQPLDSISITYTAVPVSCGATSDGEVTAIPMDGIPAYTYRWDASANNQTTATATGLPTGTYSVVVTDALGCTATALGIFVPANTAIDSTTLTLVAIDSTLDCDLEPTGALQINTAETYTYLWSNGSTDQQVDDLAAGTYSVTVSNSQGCEIILMDTITAPFVPSISPFIETLGNTSSTATSGDDLNIGSGNDQSSLGVQYNWTVSSSEAVIANPNAANSTVSASRSGMYRLTLTATSTDADACQDTGSVTLEVESVFQGMPTAFTPDGNGLNDVYTPIGLGAEDVISFKIYNRWGQIVYQGDNLENGGWDGRYQGQEQPTDEYVFVLEYQIGNTEPQARKGGFTLIR